ncbi:MAG: hypothetical protein SF069_15690 [Phycisphaerae bacterium]|nr:hypothetical protein [Phycisphaerae bacterium]
MFDMIQKTSAASRIPIVIVVIDMGLPLGESQKVAGSERSNGVPHSGQRCSTNARRQYPHFKQYASSMTRLLAEMCSL